MIAEKVGASFRYPRRTIHGTIGRMSTPTIASVYRAYALGSSSGPGHYPGSIATHQLKATH